MILRTLLRAPIRFYQLFLSPLTGANCRFHPSCSHYAIEAIDRHGPVRGAGLAFRRVLRCNPWHPGGPDPVPPPPDVATDAPRNAFRRERSARRWT